MFGSDASDRSAVRSRHSPVCAVPCRPCLQSCLSTCSETPHTMPTHRFSWLQPFSSFRPSTSDSPQARLPASQPDDQPAGMRARERKHARTRARVHPDGEAAAKLPLSSAAQVDTHARTHSPSMGLCTCPHARARTRAGTQEGRGGRGAGAGEATDAASDPDIRVGLEVQATEDGGEGGGGRAALHAQQKAAMARVRDLAKYACSRHARYCNTIALIQYDCSDIRLRWRGCLGLSTYT